MSEIRGLVENAIIVDKVEEEVNPPSIPHLGQITVNAIVYKQGKDGSFLPEAIWHDSFAINLYSDSPTQCIEEIKKKIEVIKNA